MRFNQWVDTSIDTRLYLQLQDLTTVLAHQPSFTFQYAYGSSIDINSNVITGSSTWDIDKTDIRVSGYKTDLYLRAIGTLHDSHIPSLKSYMQKHKQSGIPKFAIQLVTLLEDIRLEEIVKQKRPGTKYDFSVRTQYLKHNFTTQMATNVTRSYRLDELFCLIYLLLQANQPNPTFKGATSQQLAQLNHLKPLLYQIFEAKTTNDITTLTDQIILTLEEQYEDMLNDYLTFPIAHIQSVTTNTLFDELTRTDELGNEDMEDIDEDKNEYFDESFSTWHRENQNSDRKQNFLQFELEVGTKTNMQGGTSRETEDGDQATASVQGNSSKSEQNDYSEVEALDKQEDNTSSEKETDETPYGDANKHAIRIDKPATTPTIDEQQAYHQNVKIIEPFKRKLAATIEKTIEHKKILPTNKRPIGRLSHNLLPLVIENEPRVFYKKNQESREMDAVFTLLVDCSASMHNKMDETKRGITLFHEVLKQLKIPHNIIGFWEDANESSTNKHPNYFHRVHDMHDSAYLENGAKIMQLEPEEDNRDGFSIRIAANELITRREANKFLLVFSDGEPAAMGYDNQNGIVDTTLAVHEARKNGIECIGLFLSDGEISEHEETLMTNIYGKEHLMIPSVEALPERFAPLLKRLLLKAVI